MRASGRCITQLAKMSTDPIMYQNSQPTCSEELVKNNDACWHHRSSKSRRLRTSVEMMHGLFFYVKRGAKNCFGEHQNCYLRMEKSHGLGIQRESCTIFFLPIFDDFGLRRPVIQKPFQPRKKKKYTLIPTWYIVARVATVEPQGLCFSLPTRGALLTPLPIADIQKSEKRSINPTVVYYWYSRKKNHVWQNGDVKF